MDSPGRPLPPWGLLALTGLYVWRHGLRNWVAERRVDEWFIDCLNLLFQGAVIPLLQAWVVATLLEVWPEFAGSLDCEPWVAFLLCLSWLITAIIGISITPCTVLGHFTIRIILLPVWMWGNLPEHLMDESCHFVPMGEWSFDLPHRTSGNGCLGCDTNCGT